MSRFFVGELKKRISFICLLGVVSGFHLAQGWQSAPYVRLSLSRPAFGYGVNIADLVNTPRVRELGFEWMKGFVGWDSLEPKPDQYNWTDLSKAIVAARQNRLGLLLRVDRAPGWAGPSASHSMAPPDRPFLDDWGDMLEDLARRGKGRVAAYEIWNEPNLSSEWGGRPPDPAYYVELLSVAYRRIKLADPGALVVSAGLAPTQGAAEGEATDNLTYLRRMYELGAGAYFDVLGSHPYGFGNSPDADPVANASFRSVELERGIMVEFGDGHKPVWITETGWPLDPSTIGLEVCRQRPAVMEMLWQTVDPGLQARYTTLAYRVAYEWPWMGAMFLFNLDFATAPWYPDPCETMTFYSVLGPDGAPRATFEALKAAAKPGSGL